VALGRNGEVLVADAELGYVVRMDRNGTGLGTLGEGLFKRPTGLARDAERGHIYVADTHAHDVKVLDDDGNLLRVLGHRGEGDGEFNFPTHLCFAQGELYVTDTMNNRVQVFSAEGEVISRKFGQRGLYVGQMVRPKGVAVDEEGNVYVVESYYDHLLVYDRSGQFLLGIGGTGAATGKFYLPAGVWVDSRNRVFVADMFNGRVAVFQFLGARDG
jgi:DNA-binding beta-propeller fold protein YncE